MNKIRNITFLAIIAVICLQTIWVQSMYKSYLVEQELTTKKSFITAIEKEVTLRSRFSLKNLTISSKGSMTPEEIATHKGDTIMIGNPKRGDVAKSFLEALVQIRQDMLLALNHPTDLSILDSLFVDEFNADFPRLILSYNAEEKVQETTGELYLNQSCDISTEMIPIGTKGLQFLQLKMDVPLSGFIREMIYILAASALLILIALYGLCYQFAVIRQKEALLLKRETSVNGIIHDLKAPLNGVLMLLDWLKKGEPDESKRQLMETGKGNVQALVEDIESLLVTARGDRKEIVLDKTQVDLGALARKVKQELDLLYQEKAHGVTIEDQLPVGFMVRGDGYYLGNVFRNLIENALKYSNEGVEIRVVLSLDGKHVKVAVVDNGWGIAKVHQKKIFTQFYQVPHKSGKNSGYGVGLAYVKYIILAHGGTLKLESNEHIGSKFYFNLPI